jgi:phosphoglycerate dehydrogenase-like enzyme
MGIGLTGRTLGVVGAGRIGRELMSMARTFDLKLLAADPQVDAIELAYLGARKVSLQELLQQSDFVVVCCLLSAATHHLIGAAALREMQPEAYLINVARGPVIDEPALIEALQAGRIAGAALDVFEQEPTPTDNPLLKLPNLVASPHMAAGTVESTERSAIAAMRNILSVLDGKPIRENVVNPEVLG